MPFIETSEKVKKSHFIFYQYVTIQYNKSLHLWSANGIVVAVIPPIVAFDGQKGGNGHESCGTINGPLLDMSENGQLHASCRFHKAGFLL